MRMVVVAGLLMMALLAAVVSSVGGDRSLWVSAPDEAGGPPAQEISVVPGARIVGSRS